MEETSGPPLLSIIGPVYNEGDVVSEFVERTLETMDELADRYTSELILVDDGSRDDSLKFAKQSAEKDPRVRVLELRRNYGQTAALQAGLDDAKGEVIVTMDTDLQHFPEEIPDFLEKIEDGYDLVCGWRKDRQEGVKRRFPSKVANFMLRKISRLKINDIGTTFRAYRREVIGDVRLLGENHRFVPIFASVVGARIIEIPIKNIERPAGKSSYGLERTLNVFLDMFFLYFLVRYMDRPIRIFGKVALFCAFCGTAISAGLLGVWAVYRIPVVRDHSGWFMLAVLFMLAAMQLLMTGVLAEILARLYYSNREHAQYNVRHVWTRKNLAAAY